MTVARNGPAAVTTSSPGDRSMLDRLTTASRRWGTMLHVALLAALAYLPALSAAPGKMPSDTKLYLYLDPGRLTSDALSSWDARQFAGWVPHQTVSYLWPSGPWYLMFDKLGVPDWVAHRLWLGTLLLAGGLGVRWAARRLGLAASGALVAALCYQLSPYILPYLSRTSLLLLPWAGLGWLVGLTIGAATRTRWRDVGLFGLVMATVAAPNATAILMIAPAPILWLVHAAWGRIIDWQRAVITAVKLGAVSLAVSLWWIVMLAIQGKYGADVLGYSESLEATAFTTTSPEVLRGLGYWLFYVRDPIGFTTSAAWDYMKSGRLIAFGFGLVATGLAGLALVRWGARRYAALLVFAGVVLAVGAHPISDPSPLMSLFADRSRSSLALALRSSARAIPLSSFGLALGAGGLVAAIMATRWKVRILAPVVVGLVAVGNLPVLFNGGFVDPILTRDQDPPSAWQQAAAALDQGDLDARVLQVPGQEFGAFRWGYTVDPPLPGMTRKPLITRDLLPLGSPAAMDLVYALDDRFQEGRAELASVAPVARLLGADTVWVPNDAAFERFKTPRPELTAQLFAAGDPGLGPPVDYGTAAVSTPTIPMVDEQSVGDPAVGTPLPPVRLVPITDPQPIMRAKTGVTIVAGSGDGIVDASAAGVLTGDELIRYAADLSASGNLAAVGGAAQVVITDSNRPRAHQWRGTQDVWGFTEDGGTGTGDSGVLRADSADARLPVFPGDGAADQSIAQQRGAVIARASSYGTPSAYLPEDRPAMAVDGDPHTAWLVGDRAAATGEYLRLTSTTPLEHLRLVQPLDERNRWITDVTIAVEGGAPLHVALGDESRTAAGQEVALPGPTKQVTITIERTDTTVLAPGEGVDAVGFAEVGADRGTSREVLAVPSNVLAHVGDGQQLDIVLTRLRTRATNRWRGDPEQTLTRAFTLTRPRTFTPTITARLDQRTADAGLAALLGWTGTTADRRLAGVPAAGGWAATDGDPATAWTTPFGRAVGSTLTIPLAGGQPLASLQIRQPVAGTYARITEVQLQTESGTRTVAVPEPAADGVSLVSFDPLSGPTLQLTITSTDGAGTIDRRYGEWTILPAAISEVSGAGIVVAPLPPAIDSGCRHDLVTVDGSAVGVRLTGAVAAAFGGAPLTAQLCDAATLQLGAGEHLVDTAVGLQAGLDIDRVVLRSAPDPAPAPAAAPPVVTLASSTHTSRTVRIGACPVGCWFVFGEGYNVGWTAHGAAGDLGAPTRVDGGFNGWFLPPSSPAQTISLEWSGQAPLAIALVLSGLAVVACILLVVFDRRRRRGPATATPRVTFAAPWRATPGSWVQVLVIPVAVAGIAGLLVIAPVWGLICAAVTAVACLLRRPRLLVLGATGITVYIAIEVVHRVTQERPFANAGWPAEFEDLHRLGLSVVVLLLAAMCAPMDPTEDRSE